MFTLANAMNPTIWIVVGVLALLLFGGQKIPEMMRGLGSGMKEFKKGMTDDPKDDELRKEQEREAEVRRRVEEEMRKGS